MIHAFEDGLKVHVHRDHAGVARDLLHLEEPFVSRARTPQLAAREYLEKYGPAMGIAPQELDHLALTPETRPTEAGVEYRFLEEKTQFDSTTVAFNQTCLGLPVFEAGVAITMIAPPLRVVSAQSTQHPDVNVRRPSEEIVERLSKLDARHLAPQLGLSEESTDLVAKSLKIEKLRLIVYRYEEGRRAPAPEKAINQNGSPRESEHTHEHLSMPLPPVPEGIEPGRHYVAAEVIFILSTRHIPDLRWLGIIEAETLAVLALRPFVDSVDGLVFRDDPITNNGGPPPSAVSAALNSVRTSVQLKGLVPPVAGSYALRGDLVQLLDAELPSIAAPPEPVGTDFDFDARTDNFAAVNAYYHCSRFFDLVKELGFDLATYFGGTIFPSTVDHRGRISTSNGVEINAHCLGNGSFGILRTTFALADLGNTINPIGIACDWRVVLHELGGHGILYNHVNSPNFGFAHSAGDSFGAVLNDATSLAPDRFVTFPWVNIGRRHDRSVSTGWAWGGVQDTGGYNSEQILCTSHFRLYRSIGGDSTETAMRRFAGEYVAYLILRTVGGLTQATNPASPTAYAAALMTADLGTWTSHEQIGGAYWKVIRWAFEKQGLFQPSGAPLPVISEGAPPPVDVFIDDGRNGEYEYGTAGQFPILQRFWENADIWNRHHPDGHTDHQTPVVGEKNFAYVRVKNRGTQAASSVVVSGYHCRPTAGLVWPDDLKPMSTASLVVPGGIPSGGTAVVGPFTWKPEHRGHECMFMSVSALGDRANNDPVTLLPSATGPSPLWRLVPCDNNLGLRALVPVPGGGGRRALVAAFRRRHFWASNPFATTGRVEVRPLLPSFLKTRGWDIHLDNPGGGSFSLGPRETREIRPRLVGGQTFTAAQIAGAGPQAIEIVVIVDGLVVGGMTYLIDANLKHPATEVAEQAEEHEHHHKMPEPEHHERHDHADHKEKHARRLRVEIDFD